MIRERGLCARSRRLVEPYKKGNQRSMQGTNELSLKESEIRYRRLFEAAQDGILILDAGTGAITDVNPYLIHMLGYSREEFVERKLWEVGAFKDIKASQVAFKTLQEKEYIRHEDLPLRAKDEISRSGQAKFGWYFRL